MGGRLDATNIVTPEVAVITQIDFDHENYLGHSIEAIAGEKAGIIKHDAWVVSAAERPEARAVIRGKCDEMHARLVETDEAYGVNETVVGATLGSPSGGASPAPTAVMGQRVTVRDAHSGWQTDLAIPLLGRYQIRNALAAVAAARLLRERGFPVTDEAIARGIAGVQWPGRLELLQESPAVFLDGTHNTAGARELLAFWDQQLAGRRIHLVYGAVRDKAVDEITGLLFPRAASVILTQPKQPRAISAHALAEMTAHLAPHAEVIPDPAEALERALGRAAPEDAVFATGSLYLVGDLRRWWKTRAAQSISARRTA
jgi:dihydrofolate synthase/folylpolyglutamate synthase